MADNMRRLVDTDGIEQVDRILHELRRVEYGPLGASDLTTPRWSKTMTRLERAKNGTCCHQMSVLPPEPWANTSGGPSPTCE